MYAECYARNPQYVTDYCDGFANHPSTHTDNSGNLIYYAGNNEDRCLTISCDTINVAEIKSLKDGEGLSNENISHQESLSTYIFPEIKTRSTAVITNVSGTIKASELDNYAELVLTDNTNLYMDVNKPLRSISGDYSLTLSGGNILTIDNAGGYAIDVASVNISAPIIISSSYIAIAAQNGIAINSTVKATSTNTCIGTLNGTITINADVTATTSGSAAILSRYGDVIINSGTINATGGITNSWAYGIGATGNITTKAGTVLNVTAGTAVYSEKGNVNLADGASLTAKGENGCGVYAKEGIVTVAGLKVSQSYHAISAYNGLTINGAVEATSTNTCIGTVNGTLSINADVTATTSGSAAILSRYGDIIINSGTINATGGTTGSWAYGIGATGDIKVKDGVVIAKGGSKGVFAENGIITITPPLVVITAAGGGVSDDGHTIVCDNGEPAMRVVIMSPPIPGSLSLSSVPAPGNSLGFTLSDELASAEIENVWQISDNDVSWQDIAGATDITYIPKESEIGKYIRVKVSASDYSGYIYSPSRQINKLLCTDVPAVPVLTNINDKVHLSNAKTTQEYIIFNYSKEASSLTESDWNNAITPDSEVGFIELPSTPNANHTVFTRIKGTTSTLASENVAEARLHIGTSVYLADIEQNITKTVGYFCEINNELNCKVGDVIRCDALPVPSDATNWYGISGSNWTVDYHNTGSPYGTSYEDAECMRPIDPTTNYETVYLKTLAEKNYLEVRILVYNSGIGYKTRAKVFNVSYDGCFPSLDYINGCDHTIAVGEKLTGLVVNRCPYSGSVYGLTTEVSGEGTAPIVTFSLYETMTINAINATPGVYVYTPLQDGHPLNNNTTFTITVTDGNYPVDSVLIREQEVVADPGEQIELVAQLMPANSEAPVSWGSSDNVIATVYDGMVNISPNAEIGATVTITAAVQGSRGNEISSECVITISGEKYDLYVASTQVTSRNMDDILGDGTISFDGLGTLTIKGDINLNTPVSLVDNAGIDNLMINVEENSTITQNVGVEHTIFDLKRSTRIGGGAQLTVNANSVGFNVDNEAILTLDSANVVINGEIPMTGRIGGNESLNIINSRLEIHATGYAAIDDFGGGITLTDCIISEPEGGEVSDYTIVDANGNYV